MLLVSVAAFLNVGIVLDRAIRIGGPAGRNCAYFNGRRSPLVEYLAAVLLVLSGVYALYQTACLPGKPDPVPLRPFILADKRKAIPLAYAHCSTPSPLCAPTKGLDWMLAITAIYSVVAFTNWVPRAPQNAGCRARRRDGRLDLGEERTFNILSIRYPQVPPHFTGDQHGRETWTAISPWCRATAFLALSK